MGRAQKWTTTKLPRTNPKSLRLLRPNCWNHRANSLWSLEYWSCWSNSWSQTRWNHCQLQWFSDRRDIHWDGRVECNQWASPCLQWLCCTTFGDWSTFSWNLLTWNNSCIRPLSKRKRARLNSWAISISFYKVTSQADINMPVNFDFIFVCTLIASLGMGKRRKKIFALFSRKLGRKH